MHKFDPARAARLLEPNRYHLVKPDNLLQKLGIPPGSTLLDLGCGNGFFTFPAAAAMGEDGMVIAADTSDYMLQLLRDRNPRDNVQILKVDEVEMDVDTRSVDGAVLINIYHEFSDRKANFAELRRVLKPGGKVMVLDWAPVAESLSGPPVKHRVGLGTATRELEQWGFRIETNEPYTAESWLIIAGLART